ncbi:MAG: hypothetical protein V6S10_00825 [Candidatus Methanoglobus sp.]
MSERNFINKLYESICKEKGLGKHGWLRGVYKNKNLSTKDFQDIWSEWWKGNLPPRTEVDMILVFEDPMEALDKALIGCIEIEYFSIKDITKENFYEGLQQVLAFSIFGFDGLCLWHMFSPEIEENVIVNYANTMRELISGFNLPIFYLATKILDEKELRMKCFEPSQIEGGVEYFIDWLNSYWVNEKTETRF